MAAKTPRLDILLYAHDGRGLGHVSRTIAIGLALRRLFPQLRILFLSGCRVSQDFIGSAALDWVKLPAYETRIEDGKSKGIKGKSNFGDKELGLLRATQIEQIVSLYRPRVVLADHSPQGKHRELLPALEATANSDTRWVLGIRGIVGAVKQVHSDLPASIFQKYYSSLLWYGDSKVLGRKQLEDISTQFGKTAIECGYVSGIRERIPALQSDTEEQVCGTLSVPWFGEKTPGFLGKLHTAFSRSASAQQSWHIYFEQTHPESAKLTSLFNALEGFRVEEPGKRYLDSLVNSRCAIIYGGYNSLVDVLSLSLPTLVILRDMQDNEQQEHLQKLMDLSPDCLFVLPEDCEEDELQAALRNLNTRSRDKDLKINLNGAETAARRLHSLINENSGS